MVGLSKVVLIGLSALDSGLGGEDPGGGGEQEKDNIPSWCIISEGIGLLVGTSSLDISVMRGLHCACSNPCGS